MDNSEEISRAEEPENAGEEYGGEEYAGEEYGGDPGSYGGGAAVGKKRRKNIFYSFFERGTFDRPMFVIIMLLVSVGSVMIFSASYAYALTQYGDSRHFINSQLQNVLIGTVIMLFLSSVKYEVFKKFTILAYLFALGMLMLVLVIGVAEGEAKRWIIIGGISIQPSEIMKFALILMLAYYFDKNHRKLNIRGHFWKSTFYSIIVPMIFVALACGLIILENHLSGTIIVFLLGISVIWAGGGKWQWYLVFAVLGVVTVFLVVNYSKEIFSVFPDYVQKRVDMWLNPEAYSVQGDTWQTVQGKIAVGSGGFLGRGLGNSLQKHLFVSQPQNDFIFAIICEEFGFVGALGTILLYLVFIWRGIHIARRAPDMFASVAVLGIVAQVGIQAFLNMAVVTAILPNTGISLPFLSYGGSSLIILMAEMGVLLSISKYSRMQK